MTPLKFTELMNELPDDMIEAANRPHQKKQKRIIYIIPAAAACFSLVVALSFFLKGKQMTSDPDFTVSVDPEISAVTMTETVPYTEIQQEDVPVTEAPVSGDALIISDQVTDTATGAQIEAGTEERKPDKVTEKSAENRKDDKEHTAAKTESVRETAAERTERVTENYGDRPVPLKPGNSPHTEGSDNSNVTEAPVTAPDTADEPSPVMANQNTKPADQNTQPAVNVPGYEPEPAAPQETEPAPGAACQPACPPDAQSDPPGAADPNLPDYSPTVQADNEKKPGDVNLDGKVDKSDLTKLSEYLSDKRNPEGQAFRNADINADGNVDLTDLSLLRKLISENET
ncbi:dockerin type I domain-containing protein [Ruminococcus sp. HUN007]|uniref:dockerin type I domain-containing protein n=1 Tax=Ruminococcus sp. HUN007 TaxID=1514668 RepID=UPI0005D2CF64|nr:dockerin type I domain-containing protein [Ruminococcus sp. HUN007]